MLTLTELNPKQIQLQETTEQTVQQIKVYKGSVPSLDIDTLEFVGEFLSDAVILAKEEIFPLYYTWQDEADNRYITSYRRLPLEGTFNFRDMGGYVGKDNRRVKWGKFFRADALCKLTERDVAVLQELELKTIVDFRGDGEWQKEPDVSVPGATIINLSPNAELAKLASGSLKNDQAKIEALLEIAHSPNGKEYFEQRLDDMANQMIELVAGEFQIGQYTKFMKLILDEHATPLVFHCRGGKDRTGLAAILILLALEVSIDDITTDYHLTKEFMSSRNERRMDEYRQYTDDALVLSYLAGLMDTRQIYLDAAYTEMKKMAGSLDGYLVKVLGVSKQDIEKLQEMYLD